MASEVDPSQRDDGDDEEVGDADRGQPGPAADGMVRPRDRDVVRVDDRPGEERRTREGQERPGQGQHVGGPPRRREEEEQDRPTTEARTGDWSTQDVARRWRRGASRRIRCTQTPPHADVMTLASTAIIVPVGPANAAAAGTTQKLRWG